MEINDMSNFVVDPRDVVPSYLSHRDWLAGLAMQTLVLHVIEENHYVDKTCRNVKQLKSDDPEDVYVTSMTSYWVGNKIDREAEVREIAESAYKIADAMIERAKEK